MDCRRSGARRPPRRAAGAVARDRRRRAGLSLPDGSQMLLSVATRLRMPRDFGVRERRVELDGEAYFVIQHDSLRPFVVRTPYGTAEDLGTEFDVHAYEPEDGVAVVVARGRVALHGPDGAPRRGL